MKKVANCCRIRHPLPEFYSPTPYFELTTLRVPCIGWKMDWKRNIMRSDAARLLPEKAKELIRKAEADFAGAVQEIRNGQGSDHKPCNASQQY